MHPTVHSHLRPVHPEGTSRLAVIGAGRLGSALARALRESGFEVEGPLGRGAAPRGCHAVVLCVPDSEIPAAAEAATAAAPFIGHTSGATPLSALAPAGVERFGLHPLQSFAHDTGPEAFRGVGCAIAGSSREALELASTLAGRLGMTPFEIDDAGRGAYHAAASVASNFLVTLAAAAETIAAGAGLEPQAARALLAPLMRGTVANVEARGPEAALTGPIARGDEATLAVQRGAVEAVAPELLELFDELVRRTRSLAGGHARRAGEEVSA